MPKERCRRRIGRHCSILKTAYLVSALVKKGYDVHVIMTKNALEFISALTFETISGNAVITDTFHRSEEHDVKHVALSKKSGHVYCCACHSQYAFQKLPEVLRHDMLTTTLLAAKCPVVLAPAMNTAMYETLHTQGKHKDIERAWLLCYGYRHWCACLPR